MKWRCMKKKQRARFICRFTRKFFPSFLQTMPPTPPLALVTGATGYVASEITLQLLRKGWTVRGTVRDVEDGRSIQLTRLASALPGTLTLHSANMVMDGAFDALAAGCAYIFHVASPFFILGPSHGHDELIEPALAGTVNVLAAAAKAKATLKRVILTSSVAAVHGDYGTPPVAEAGLYSEADWNASSSVANGQAYHASKAQAEEEAWRIAKARGLDLVCVLPNFVLGPPLLRGAAGTSVGFMKGLIEGKTAPSGAPVICDVRDVARAHVLAAETPGASGRYIVSHAGPLAPALVEEVLKERLPGCVVRPAEPVAAEELRPRIDGSRAAADLGLSLRSMRETVGDMVTVCCGLGLAVPVEQEGVAK